MLNNKFFHLAKVIVAAALLWAGSASAADMNIVVLDTVQAILGTDEAQKLAEAANQELEEDQADLANMREQMVALQERVQKDGEVMSPAELAGIRSELEELQVDYNFNGQKLQKAVQEARQEILRALAPKFEAVLKDIIQVDQIDLVLNPQTLQYANPKHDITRRVTEKMNEQREE